MGDNRYIQQLKVGDENMAMPVTGDVGTDYYTNNTSSKYPGFRSNIQSESYLSYSLSRNNVVTSNLKSLLSKPVIQVKDKYLPVEKVWADGADHHDDDSVTIQLCKVEGDDVIELEGETLVLNKANNWKGAFHMLEENVNYTVVEKSMPEGYEGTITEKEKEDGTKYFEVTNTPSTTKLVVEKVWSDSALNNHEDDEVTIRLYQKTTGEPIDLNKSVVLNDENNWKDEFKDLETEDDDGNQIDYIVKEDTVPGYITSIEEITSDTDEDGIMYYKVTVTNTVGQELPKSGGPGTMFIYVLGMLFITAGGVLVILRNRERRAE